MDRFEAREWIVRRIVFDPLTTAQRRHLGTALSRVAETVRREMSGPVHCGADRIFRPSSWRIPQGRAPGGGNMIMATQG
ncbi:hypothetical protein [Nocardia brasiliensis]|nr:hypothetical protein [Nocardia brasiliensis]OCF83723.1 hypothetical protein AW168_00885 [Nocardia brasiliensis]